MPLDTIAILKKYFDAEALEVVAIHGRAVAGLSLSIGRCLALPEQELRFIEEAAMLHDIGICRVRVAGIGLQGEHPYIMHGILGRDILEQEGLPRHALVCERHIGVGLTVNDIVTQKLPLPLRDMRPQSINEEIICFSDLFFSKKQGRLEHRKSADQVRVALAVFGADKTQTFDAWMSLFGAAL